MAGFDSSWSGSTGGTRAEQAARAVRVKFHIAELERKGTKEVNRAIREAAKLILERIRAMAPEDEGTLVKALAIHVRNRKWGPSALIGVKKNVMTDEGIPAYKYVRRKELGFYGKDKLGRMVLKESRGLRFFQRGLEISRHRVIKTLDGMKL